MKKTVFTLITCLGLISFIHAQTFNLDRDFGTYFGDERFSLQSSVVDGNGDLYITGYINYENYGDATEDYTYFDNSPHQSEFAGGPTDGFIAKFNAEGELLWATLFGGEGIDVIENITADKENNIYIMGATTSLTGISTPNAYQTERLGGSDMFIAKFDTNGEVVWSTYFGSTENSTLFDLLGNFTNWDSDGNFIVLDDMGNLYVTTSLGEIISNTETVSSYNDTIGLSCIAKFTQDGEFVWSTSYGINSNEISGVSYGDNGLIITGHVTTLPGQDNTYYGEENAYQPEVSPGLSSYIAKFSPDGERVWGTYYSQPGTGGVMCRNNALASDNAGNIYKILISSGPDLFSTPGAFQEDKDMNASILFTKFSETPNGETTIEREWATYYGLGDNVANSGSPQAVTIGEDGYIYISGAEGYPDNIASEGAWQETIPSPFKLNGFIAKFDADGNRIWGTFYNGEDNSRNVRAFPYGMNEHFYITGITLSYTGMSTENALQPDRIMWDSEASTSTSFGIFIAHFSPETSSLPSENLSKNINVYPNPNPNDGSFTISSKENIEEISIYSIQGHLVKNQVLDVPLTEIKIEDLQAGAYFVTLKLGGNQMISKKVFVN